jgi:hypothetical protein
MSIIKANGAGDQSTGFYKGVATQSARFNGRTEDTSLFRTIGSSGGSRRKAVYSWWMKGDYEPGSPYFWSKGSGGGVADIMTLNLNTDRLQVIEYIGDSNTLSVITKRKFRDPSAWYHIVFAFDSTQATDTNRIQIFVNGIKETVMDTASYPSQNHDFVFGWYQTGNAGSTKERIGGYEGTYYSGDTDGDRNSTVNGYLAEFNYIDGLSFFSDTSGTVNTSFNINSFGQYKNGVWIPIEYTGSYGNEGWRLEFKQTGTGTASTSTIGADTSGNNNHFSSVGLASTDCNIPDSPENNFCTLHPEGRRYGQSYMATFSEGMLKAVHGGNASHIWGTMAINQIASQGGVYFEVRMDSTDTSRTYGGVIGDNGVNNLCAGADGASYSFPIKGVIGLMASPRAYFSTDTDSTGSLDTSSNSNFVDGDVVGFAILSDGKFFCHRNGTYMTNADGNTGNPSTGANPIATIDLTEGDWVPYVGYASSFTVNFGQDGSFNGTETSGGNQDANGIGDFMFAVPTNCLALCTSNMAEPAIGPNSATKAHDLFDYLKYTGTGNDNTDIGDGSQSEESSVITSTATANTKSTSISFKPDLIWTFPDSNATHNLATDSSRGVFKDVFLSTGAGESNDTNGIKVYNSNGFRLGTSTNHNVSSRVYYTWCWKANGGTATLTNDASATGVGSIDSVCQANTTAGFSIVTYTGDSSGNDGTASTVAHGLGSAPQWIVTIPLNVNDGASFHHENTTAPETDTLIIASTSGNNATYDGSGFWNDTAPTSTVFSVGTRRHTNSDGGMVAYCWTEVEGFSKFGSFNGNASTDGTFVYCGFRPLFVMTKCSPNASHWHIYSPVLDTGNPTGFFRATEATAYQDYNYCDFLSNGFKIRDNGTEANRSAANFVFMAFADTPFKYANAR